MLVEVFVPVVFFFSFSILSAFAPIRIALLLPIHLLEMLLAHFCLTTDELFERILVLTRFLLIIHSSHSSSFSKVLFKHSSCFLVFFALVFWINVWVKSVFVSSGICKRCPPSSSTLRLLSEGILVISLTKRTPISSISSGRRFAIHPCVIILFLLLHVT